MLRRFFLLFLCIPGFLFSQSSETWTGKWAGTLHTEKGDLKIIIKISVKNNGWYSQLSVPDQGVTDVALSGTVVEKKSYAAKMDYPEASFSGKRVDTATIKGYWTQNDKSLPLTLNRVWGEWPVPKAQTPAKPYPWISEEVKIPVAGGRIMVAGELDKPDSVGKFPVIILISGSGPQDRNGSIGEHKPFLVLTQKFISLGYAVLRCDDRGAGKTRGQMTALVSTTTADQAMDVMLFLDFLKTRKDIDSNKMGLLGHSEGGIIAPYVAARRNDVAFLVLMAAPASGGLEANMYQNRLALQRANLKESEIASFLRLHTQMLQNLCTLKDTTGWRDICDSLVTKWLTSHPSKKTKKMVFGGKKTNYAAVQETYQAFLIPWFKFFITYDPAADLQKTTIPILALNGSEDKQVACDPNLQAIAKNAKFAQTRCIAGLNHLFQTCKTCETSEYLTLDETLNNAFMDSLGEWLIKMKQP